MDLTQLANLGEFIGGFAVLVTLVYLAVQVRQNTSALSANRHHDMLDTLIRHDFSARSMNREYADFLNAAIHTPDELDDVDWERFVSHAYGTFAMWEESLLGHRRGMIDDQIWISWDGAGRSLWSGPGFKKFWEQEGKTHSPMFQDYVNSEIFPPKPGS